VARISAWPSSIPGRGAGTKSNPRVRRSATRAAAIREPVAGSPSHQLVGCRQHRPADRVAGLIGTEPEVDRRDPPGRRGLMGREARDVSEDDLVILNLVVCHRPPSALALAQDPKDCGSPEFASYAGGGSNHCYGRSPPRGVAVLGRWQSFAAPVARRGVSQRTRLRQDDWANRLHRLARDLAGRIRRE
jgi:hypothetical protein